MSRRNCLRVLKNLLAIRTLFLVPIAFLAPLKILEDGEPVSWHFYGKKLITSKEKKNLVCICEKKIMSIYLWTIRIFFCKKNIKPGACENCIGFAVDSVLTVLICSIWSITFHGLLLKISSYSFLTLITLSFNSLGNTGTPTLFLSTQQNRYRNFLLTPKRVCGKYLSG